MSVDFDEWYQRQHGRILVSCIVFSGDRGAAEEATDEAFSRALAAWGDVSAMASPDAWVCKVAINCLRRALRRRRFEQVWLARQRPATAWTALPRPDLWAAVGRLPVRQRTAVVLRYVADLPDGEVAAVMNISRGTVAATLSTARASLRSALKDDMEGVPGA